MSEHRIAEILHVPVRHMKEILTTSEFNKWIAYLSFKNPDVNEIQLAVLSTLVSNGLGGKAKVNDFIVSKVAEEKKPQDIFGMFNACAKTMK